jgi:hypothetical protein
MASTETAILQSDSKEKIKLLLKLAKELSIKSKVLSVSEAEEYYLSSAIEEGMKTADASRDDVLKALKR